MKIAINACYGGFSLSPAAIQRLAELQGRPCYFFKNELSSRSTKYALVNPDEGQGIGSMMLVAFDIPNPDEVFAKPGAEAWTAMSQKDRQAHNELYSKHLIDQRPDDRTDANLIRVIEELGSAEASGMCAKLKVIEIPDSTDWELDEYDGIEHVAEKHATWS